MRKSALAAGGIALVMALSACGGGDTSGNPLGTGGGEGQLFSNMEQLVASASEKTSQSKSANYTMEMTMMGQQIKAEGQILYDGANTKMSMTMESEGMDAEVRMVDGTMYIKMPEQVRAQMGVGDKPWAKTSVEDATPMGNGLDQLAERSDPSKLLENLSQAGGKIKNSESTTLDGQQVTHYTIEVDPGKAAEMMGGTELPEQQKQQLEKVGNIPMELYLDAEGLPARIEMDMKAVVEAAGAPGGEAGMVMTYSDWGTPVSIEAPPADQVGEMPTN